MNQPAAPDAKDHKAWARKIIARYEYGQKISSYALRCAHEVLGLQVPGLRHKAATASHPQSRGQAHEAQQSTGVHGEEFA